MTDNDLRKIQNQIIKNPNIGDIEPGVKGVRKLRYASVGGQGKSSGSRVHYIILGDTCYFFAFVPKNVAENLTKKERNELAKFVDHLKNIKEQIYEIGEVGMSNKNTYYDYLKTGLQELNNYLDGDTSVGRKSPVSKNTKKLKVKEQKSTSVKKYHLQEINKGYSRQVYSALDDAFTDSDGKAELVYIADAVDMWLFNTQNLYKEIFNNRRKATSIAYGALIDLFQDTVDGYDVKVRVTSEMVKQWFKRVGLNYIDCLKPVVDKIEEEREEARQTKKESIRRPRRKSMRESSDEIARKGFVSLVPDTFNGGYIVLNDGNFVCKISAVDDEDAIYQFYRFLKTDWNSAWRNGTLPRYFGESFGEYSSKKACPYDKTKRWTFSWHVKDNPVTYAHNDSMLVLADTEHAAIETAFDRIDNEFDYAVTDVDYYDVEEILE